MYLNLDCLGNDFVKLIDVDALECDFSKKLSCKQIALKYNLAIWPFQKIYRDNKGEIKRRQKINTRVMLKEYNSGVSIKTLAKEYSLNKRFIESVINEEEVATIVNRKLQNIKGSYREIAKNELGSLVADLYGSGNKLEYLKDKYKISPTLIYLSTTDGVPSFKPIKNLEDIYLYQYLLALAYDNAIITNNDLRKLFAMNFDEVESRICDTHNNKSFLYNKLYQIYVMPSLLYKFNFTDESIRKEAYNFINKRFSEDLNDYKKRGLSMDDINNLREVYYNTKSSNYIKKKIK